MAPLKKRFPPLISPCADSERNRCFFHAPRVVVTIGGPPHLQGTEYERNTLQKLAKQR